MHMHANTIEAILALALACARSFGEAVTRDACEALAEQAAMLEVASSPIAQGANPLGLVADLHGVDPMRLSATDRVRYLKRAVAHTAWAESRVNAALLAIAGTSRRVQVVRLAGHASHLESIEIEDAARSEIALAARWTEAQAQSRLESARLIHHLLPTAGSALASGEISQAHAGVITEGASRLAAGIGVDALAPNAIREGEAWEILAAAVSQLDSRATVIAARSNRSRTRSAVTRIVDTLDPEGMRRRREHAVRDRGVWVQPEGDGNSLLISRMSTMQANACLTRVRERAQQMRNAAAQAGERDSRGIGELRADALAEIVLVGTSQYRDRCTNQHAAKTGAAFARGAAAGGQGTCDQSTCDQNACGQSTCGQNACESAASRLRADIDVVITLDALLALQRLQSDDTAMLRGPSDDEDFVPAAEIRDLLVGRDIDVRLRRLVTDSITGHLLDVSPRRYIPSERMREFIETRDLRCRWPGCNARATGRGIDIDHAIPFDRGGTTQRANLGALCRRHHLLKTHAGFDVTDSDESGSCTLLTPSGAEYSHAAVAVLPADDPPPFSLHAAQALVPLPTSSLAACASHADKNSGAACSGRRTSAT